jgi:hypothetical protein
VAALVQLENDLHQNLQAMLSSAHGSIPANLPPCTFRIELGLSSPIDFAVDDKSHVISLVIEMAPRPIAMDSTYITR